jgi:hypothetical protein
MSEHVTWEICLQCGLLAAVGWAPVVRRSGAQPENRPVEFDCRAGCQVSLDELAEAYGLPLRRTSAE